MTPSLLGDGLPWRRGTSVVLIDPTRLIREALADQFRNCRSIGEVRTAASMDDAVLEIRALSPAIVLVNMAGRGSMASLAELRDVAPDAEIIAIGVAETDDEEIVGCAEIGVAGLLPRSGSLADLEVLIDSVVLGDAACSPRITAALLRRVSVLGGQQVERPQSSVNRLTPREREVLELIGRGWTNKQIARSLCIEVRTVKNHVHNLLQKLQVSRRGQAAARFRATTVPPRDTAHTAHGTMSAR